MCADRSKGCGHEPPRQQRREFELEFLGKLSHQVAGALPQSQFVAARPQVACFGEPIFKALIESRLKLGKTLARLSTEIGIFVDVVQESCKPPARS